MKSTKFIAEVYGGLGKEIWTLATAMFLNRCGSMVLLFLSVYLTEEKKLTLPQTGIIISLYGLGSMTGAFIGGKLVDKIGFYPILLGSLLFTGLSIIILGYMPTFYTIAPLAFLVTAFADSFRPANSASISKYSKPENFTKSIALNRLAMNLGFTISPILGGYLATQNYSLLFWADGVTSIVAASFLWIVLKKPEPSNSKQNDAIDKKVETISSPYRDVNYLLFSILVTLYATVFFQFFTAFPLYYKKVYLLSEKSIGGLMAINGIGVAVMEMFLIHYIQNKWTQFKFIGLGCILLIGAFAIYLLTQSIAIILISLLLLTFSEMFAMPFMSTFALNRAPANAMGRYSALYSMSWSLALIISPILGTNIIDNYGFPALWIVLSGLAMVTFVGFRWVGWRIHVEKNLLK